MLISPEYRAQQIEMHENPNYGVASVEYAPQVAAMIRNLGVTELLDYGSGKGRLGQALAEHDLPAFTLHQYDPGVEGLAEPPEPAEMVACIDVLEHIEPECLDAVLDDLRRVTEQCGFFTVHTGPAKKVLPDGRNAHLIQEDLTFWLPKLWCRFDIVQYAKQPNGFIVLCR